MPDPLHALQAAARAYAYHMGAATAVHIVKLCDASGKKLVQILVPACASVVDPTTPAEGWDFSEATPRLDGTSVPIYGKPLTVLKLLAASKGPVPSKVLAKAWDDYEPSESTVRNQIAELRAKLKELFPLREEQISYIAGAGFELLIR